MNEVFATECPFCGQRHVRLPIKPHDVQDLRDNVRKLGVVFPCCHTRLQFVDADGDYLLADKPLRRRG